MSIVSEKHPIQQWLDTPEGFYVGFPLYGNIIHKLLFKNTMEVRRNLGLIIDAIERDLGSEVAQSIISIDLAKDGIGKRYITILSYDGIYSITEVNT